MAVTYTDDSWTDANQAYLVCELARLRHRLETRAAGQECCETDSLDGCTEVYTEEPTALENLILLFGLSRFERDLVLLAAGVEMDSTIAGLCAQMSAQPSRASLTFGLAMASLAEPHWSAITPARPLRAMRLVNMEAGAGLTSAPMRIDERILHYLAGINVLDSRLETFVRPGVFPDEMSADHREVSEQALRLIRTDSGRVPVIHLFGDDALGQEDVSALVAAESGLRLYVVKADELPPVGPELDQFLLLWSRESLLLPGALLIQCALNGLTGAGQYVAERLQGLLFISSNEPINLNCAFLRFDVDKPGPAEQRRLWEAALGKHALPTNAVMDDLSQQFRLSTRTIYTTSTLVGSNGSGLKVHDLWNVCRSLTRPKLENLAQRLIPVADWNNLVLPRQQIETLEHLAAQVRQRMKVYEAWGFASQGRRGLGVSALFAGESGTGKTLAAEVLANELDLDLYRIDLSAVVSKYIGETEKNLKQVFDGAEEGGALLLFDEADALFGKRSDVKDSHDRYANIEVGYLLQRMEAYQGLAILTTNMKSALDQAFQRRLRFTIHFPFPDAEQREAIWTRIFPSTTPTKGLDYAKLAQLKVTGGSIRNIALNAAFLAAETDTAVRMEHLLQAAELETHKIERSLSQAETRGWV
jgi:hypothetical protein